MSVAQVTPIASCAGIKTGLKVANQKFRKTGYLYNINVSAGDPEWILPGESTVLDEGGLKESEAVE